jgi:ubiquinone/menaquinone biosynthesis C-methylase UbiE
MRLVHASNINQNKFDSCKLLHSRRQSKLAELLPLAVTISHGYNQTLMARSDAQHRYAIRGGMEGKKRLDLLARVMLPTTVQLLDRAGLVRGMKCLDVGSGGSHVAMLIAGIVGPEGRVIGTDTDAEILALAKEDAEGAKLTNVTFQQLDACARLWREDFDISYVCFLLSHLNEPKKCLRAMVEACVPGGTIVIEDTDFAGSFCYPNCGSYERYKELYQELVQRWGGAGTVASGGYRESRAKRRPTRSHSWRRQNDGANHDVADSRRVNR